MEPTIGRNSLFEAVTGAAGCLEALMRAKVVGIWLVI